MAKVRPQHPDDPDMMFFYCPGCKGLHGFSAKQHAFNGNFNLPTLSPSVLVTGWIHTDEPGHEYDSKEVHCHSFVKDGHIQFLADCNHGLAGKTVELPDIT